MAISKSRSCTYIDITNRQGTYWPLVANSGASLGCTTTPGNIQLFGKYSYSDTILGIRIKAFYSNELLYL